MAAGSVAGLGRHGRRDLRRHVAVAGRGERTVGVEQRVEPPRGAGRRPWPRRRTRRPAGSGCQPPAVLGRGCPARVLCRRSRQRPPQCSSGQRGDGAPQVQYGRRQRPSEPSSAGAGSGMQAAATYSPNAASASGTSAALAVPVDQRGDPALGLQRAAAASARWRRPRSARRAAPGRGRAATEAMARPGPVRPVALRKTCGACSSGTRTKPMSSPGPQHLHGRPADGRPGSPGGAPPGPAMIRSASRAASTGRVSPVGAAVAMLPPRVPALRICGGPGGARGRGERRDERGEVGAAHPGVGEAGAEQRVSVLVLPAADLADPAEADEARRA